MSASDVKRREKRAELLRRFEEAMEWPMLFLALMLIPRLGVPLAIDVDSTPNLAIEAVSDLVWALFAVHL